MVCYRIYGYDLIKLYLMRDVVSMMRAVVVVNLALGTDFTREIAYRFSLFALVFCNLNFYHWKNDAFNMLVSIIMTKYIFVVVNVCNHNQISVKMFVIKMTALKP